MVRRNQDLQFANGKEDIVFAKTGPLFCNKQLVHQKSTKFRPECIIQVGILTVKVHLRREKKELFVKLS